jgi:hypothetical protein
MLQDNGRRDKIHLRIFRGAPVCDVNRKNFSFPKGSRFVGLKDGKREHGLLVWKDSLTLKYSETDVMTDSVFRYVRMYLRDDTISVGEIGFQTSEGLVSSVKVLTEVETFSPYENAEMLVDGIDATTCRGKVRQGYIDFDLGKEYRLTGIGFYPYLESELMEGDYELMYWSDGDWRSVGIKSADGSGFITFDNVPSNCLLMLKNRNKGWGGFPSERTFICGEDGHICWE